MVAVLHADIAADCRSLSSGTMAKIMRDAWFEWMATWKTSQYRERRSLQVNPLATGDQWHIAKVQYALWKFAELNHGEFDSWQECWTCYLCELRRVRFQCSYMGSVDYTVEGYGDKRIECHYSVSDYYKSIYNGTAEEFENGPASMIGCAHWQYSGKPIPPDVAVLFPLFTVGYYDYDDGCKFKADPDAPAVKIGKTKCGYRCMWSEDGRFYPSVDQWEEWGKIALSLRS